MQKIVMPLLALLMFCGCKSVNTAKGSKLSSLDLLEQGYLEQAKAEFEKGWQAGNAEDLRNLFRIAALTSNKTLSARLLNEVQGNIVSLPAGVRVRAAFNALSLPNGKDKYASVIEAARQIVNEDSASHDDKYFSRQINAKVRLLEKLNSVNEIIAEQGVSYTLPLSVFAGLPIAYLSINGSEKLPFIVDTGASGLLVTKNTAEKYGLKPIEGTDFEGLALEDKVKTQYTRLDLSLGSVLIKNSHAVMMDLPLQSIAGIISPQTLLKRFRVELDFTRYELRLMSREDKREGDTQEQFPLVLAQSCPIVFARASTSTPRRALLLDTGSNVTKLGDQFLTGVDYTTREGEDEEKGASNVARKTNTANTKFDLKIGEIDWSIEQPNTFENKRTPERDLRHLGLIGMDFLNGRTLVMDRSTHSMGITPRANFAKWAKDSAATFDVSGTKMKDSLVVTEVVKDATDSSVTLGVTITDSEGAKDFDLLLDNDWSARGQWLLTRRARRAFTTVSEKEKDLSAEELQAMWMRAFYPFGTENKPPGFRMIVGKLDDKKLVCGEMTIDATTKGEKGRLSIVECPSLSWRTVRIKLEVGEQTYWQYHRRGFEVVRNE